MAGEQTERKRRQWWRIDGDRVLLNTEATAAFFRVNPRTLLSWADKGCPKEELPGSWYDPAAVMRWKDDSDDPETGGSQTARKLRAETRYREAKAKQAELDYDAQRGLYFEKALVESEWAKRILELKAGLSALSREIGKHFTDPAIKAELERVINDETYNFLDKYSREGTYTPQTAGQKKGRAKGNADSKTRGPKSPPG